MFRCLLGLGALALGWGCFPRSGPLEGERVSIAFQEEGVAVSGSAVARAEPDLVIFRIGYTGTSASAVEAQRQGSEVMRRVVEALRGKGIQPGDVRTDEYSLTRLQDPQGRPIGGWKFRNIVEVRVHQVNAVAELIDAGVSAGANVVLDVHFTVTEAKLEELRTKAREDALGVARRRAEQIAQRLGFKLGKPLRVDDSEPYVQYAYAKLPAIRERPGEWDSGAGVSGGQVTVESTVRVVFKIE